MAVKTIDGPLLVIAGPGTGKTQLLSARVAYILQETDTLPENILCLTFTESGAFAMRRRLESMIGQEAHKVTISTYHSFGSEIIKNYPEFFQQISVDKTQDIRYERPIDELTAIQIVENILDQLSYDNPMLSARYYVKSVVGAISEFKRALLSPEEAKKIAITNLSEVEQLSKSLNEIVSGGAFSRKKLELMRQYSELCDHLGRHDSELCKLAFKQLTTALEEADSMNSTKTLTKWKNKWLYKNDEDRFEFTRKLDHERLLAFADIYKQYQVTLSKNGLYDFDDMILSTIDAIKSNAELRFNLQEKYQYILLDEFQDTNPSQFELVHLLSDHPVHEGRPNIMAVGDDDQAIYAFQGADIGNMRKFLDTYREVAVVNLTQNYRSHHAIIETAHNISSQIEDRLHHSLEGIEKTLQAASADLPENAKIKRHLFESRGNEYAWIASEIEALIKGGVEPAEIAVLSPKHRLLELLVPFLAKRGIPISYEKRENIFETRTVEQLLSQAELVLTLASNDQARANQLFARVLSEEYWQIAVEHIWRVNWQRIKKDESRNWAEIALDTPELREAVLFYLKLGLIAKTTPLETMLDYLSGVTELPIDRSTHVTSPLKNYYYSAESSAQNPLEYYENISHLSVIRSKLREYQNSHDNRLTLADFVELAAVYKAAEQPLINTHPISQSDNSVQLMTAYKAKGLEFQYVFLVSLHEDVWGKSSRSQSNKFSLPQNLTHIRYQGSSEDELKRLLYVAVTRAKYGLFLSSHDSSDTGKKITTLRYLNEIDGVSAILPTIHSSAIRPIVSRNESLEANELLWHESQIKLACNLKDLLQERLDHYKLSPTHLNTFLDLIYGGPEAFVIGTLLRFPQAPSLSGEYGTAIHNTLEWYQNKSNQGSPQSVASAVEYVQRELDNRYIAEHDLLEAKKKASRAISAYLTTREELFKSPAKTEVNFAYEGVVLGEARLSGKIDRLEINDQNKAVHIVDYKTGSSLSSWKTGSDLKARKYQQQLYLYKLLIENSTSFKGYTVRSARLEFVEPFNNGQIPPALYIEFDLNIQNELVKLIQKIWNSIQNLELPNTREYDASMSGINKFEKDLLSKAE